MERILVRDSMGLLTGMIEINERGDKIVRDSRGRYLGRYDVLTDTTMDPMGRFLYKGDQASILFGIIKLD